MVPKNKIDLPTPGFSEPISPLPCIYQNYPSSVFYYPSIAFQIAPTTLFYPFFELSGYALLPMDVDETA
jgi:hypothetical protein